jgi:hypothetical protein
VTRSFPTATPPSPPRARFTRRTYALGLAPAWRSSSRSRTDVLKGQNMTSSTHYEPDFDALRRASTRVVIAAGAESEGELANRGAYAVAERLGTKP